jgi:hypothetical protein
MDESYPAQLVKSCDDESYSATDYDTLVSEYGDWMYMLVRGCDPVKVPMGAVKIGNIGMFMKLVDRETCLVLVRL